MCLDFRSFKKEKLKRINKSYKINLILLFYEIYFKYNKILHFVIKW